MNLFSISDLQQFSGIKAHTIRIWEQRYNALTPFRSEGNTRHYSNEQLRRLLNIVSLMESDFKVSELCAMPDEKLFDLVEAKQNNWLHDDSEAYFVSQLISAAISFNEVHFEKVFSNCLLRMGLIDTYTKVIYPMLNRVGIMWSTGKFSPAYEHFSSNLIRQKLFSAIDSLPPAKTVENSWLLFLPENEFHEIGLLFSNFLIRQAGVKVVYLGTDVPFETLIDAVEKTSPAHLLFFLVHYDTVENAQKYIGDLKKSFGDIKIHLSGNEKLISQLQLEKRDNWIRSINEELTQRQKVIVLLRLLEFINKNEEISELENEFVSTVAEVFNIDTDEFTLARRFVEERDECQIDSPNIMLLGPSNLLAQGNSKHFVSELVDGFFRVLRIPSVNLHFIKYQGSGSYTLSGQLIFSDRSTH